MLPGEFCKVMVLAGPKIVRDNEFGIGWMQIPTALERDGPLAVS